jgi:UDP:flavonoid glycosyltransferase YjiC (YdhE family)
MEYSSADRPLVLLYIVDAGGGHRAAATALIAAAALEDPGYRLEIVTIQDVLAPVDWMRRFTGRSLEDTYNEMVRRGWTWGLVPLLRGLQWLIRRLHAPLVSLFATHLALRRPALVVSLAPNFNAPLRDAVRRAHPGVPFYVMLTDIADFPPHFWMEPGLDGIVVASEDAAAQARSVGLPPARIAIHSGMPLHPRFYPRCPPEQRTATRRELGIPADAFVSLLLFGGKGTPEMVPLSRWLLRDLPDGHVIAVAGSNPRIHEKLKREAAGSPRLHACGFTDQVAALMAASDVLVTKPGPGVIAEALHQRVPIVAIANGRTVPQERYNAEYLAKYGLGCVEHRWRDLAACVRRLAGDAHERRGIAWRQAALPENQAVFEALDFFAACLAARTAADPTRPPTRV